MAISFILFPASFDVISFDSLPVDLAFRQRFELVFVDVAFGHIHLLLQDVFFLLLALPIEKR